MPRAIVLEPVARSTAPAIAVAALLIEREDPAVIVAVMPSDHDGAFALEAFTEKPNAETAAGNLAAARALPGTPAQGG
jgi:mannose-1-phosphate guanylyltransferase